MGVSHKSYNAQLFRLMVYQRPLHPELLNLQERQLHQHGDYEAECWIAPSGHVVRFQADPDNTLTEVVIEKGDHLPESGLVHALPCMGEKEFELESESNIGYVTTIQTESLTENLFLATYREMRTFALESNALLYEWKNNDGVANLSMLDCQKFKREFHIQSYHMIGASSMVLRTQSIFEITKTDNA